MMRPIESSNLRVDGIVETCINVAEISRAREFYQSLFNFEAMVSDERFCALRLGRMCCCSSPMVGLMHRSLFAEASSLRMRHVALATPCLRHFLGRARYLANTAARVWN